MPGFGWLCGETDGQCIPTSLRLISRAQRQESVARTSDWPEKSSGPQMEAFEARPSYLRKVSRSNGILLEACCASVPCKFPARTAWNRQGCQKVVGNLQGPPFRIPTEEAIAATTVRSEKERMQTDRAGSTSTPGTCVKNRSHEILGKKPLPIV